MDAIELLRWQIRDCYAWLEMTLRDIRDEQTNWRPPGVANSIGSTYAHLMITADVGFHSQLHGGMPLMATRFKGDVGLSEMPHAAGGWHDWSRLRVDWQALRRYGQAVCECVEGYLDGVTDEELAKPVDMRPHGLGMWKGLDIYNLHGISHPRLHGGEIACLKGLQGAPGWELRWRSGIEAPA